MPVEERRPVDSPVREKPRPAPPASMPSNGNGSAAADIRRRVPYAFAPANLAALGLRGVRVASLLAVDIAGITGGVYAALVLREVWMGRTPPWDGLWSTAADWFGFLWLVTALVFAQAGLYAARQRRPGTARIVSSVLLVGALTLAFALGTDFDFRTYAIVPTSIAIAAVLIVTLRLIHDRVAVALQARGRPRRAAIVGTGEALEHLQRELTANGSGGRWTIVEALDPAASTSGSNGLGALGDVLARERLDELIVAEPGLDEASLLEAVDIAHRHGINVHIAPTRDEAAGRPAEILPGHVTPLIEVRPPVFAGAEWLPSARFDIVVSLLVLLIGLPHLARDRGRGEAQLARLGAVPRPPDRSPRARVRDAEVPHDGGGCAQRDASGCRRQTKRTARCSRSERPASHTSRLRPAPASRSTRFRRHVNVLRGEMSLVGPSAAAGDRLRRSSCPGNGGARSSSRRDRSVADLGSGGSRRGRADRLDFHYVERWSIWLDAVILLKTVPAVISGRGAY